MLRESLRMSLANIRGNKMRSFLTVLGIIIGVMAIIALITVMQSATGEVTAQFESLGTGKLTVQTWTVSSPSTAYRAYPPPCRRN